MSNVWIFIQLQLMIMVSAPSFRKRKSGKRLVRNASFTAVLTCFRAQSGVRGLGESVERMGEMSSAKIMTRLDVIIRGVVSIAFTWSCTKSFWFLRPTDELLSFRSFGRGSSGV